MASVESPFHIQFFCSWWGSSHLGMEKMITNIASAGYDGVELEIPELDSQRTKLRGLLEKQNLAIIAHQFCAAELEFDTYFETFRANLTRACEFGPLLVNSHTGSDRWSFDQNSRLVECAADISAKAAIPILDETHRGRVLYSAGSSLAYFERFPDLRITADLGHWTCVAASLLRDQQDIVDLAISRADHLHARVGFADGPQVLDPFDGRWSEELRRFIEWWRAIVDRRRSEGSAGLTITLEAGPVLSGDSTEQTPEPDFWASNLAMREFLASIFVSSAVETPHEFSIPLARSRGR